MIKIWKKVGQTPLELLKEMRLENPALENETLSYAGRLDPMAEGEMLILVGKQENKDREKYLHLDKQYEAEIVLGFSTDSYDLLGLVTDQIDSNTLDEETLSSLPEKIEKVLKDLLNKKNQKYPVFSSKTVSGRTLFDWYKSGEIDQIEIPSRDIEIKEAKLLSIDSIELDEFRQTIENRITLVKGDFRQNEIIEKWQSVTKNPDLEEITLPVIRIVFEVSSGTYIRGLAQEIGEKLEIPACLFSLKRTEILKP